MAILFGLVVLSIPYIRHRFYETFYFSHFFLAIAYLGLCFWHSGQEGDSWAYLWATLALWLLSILGRVFYHNQSFKPDNPWLTGFPTRLRALPDSMTRIDILVPSAFSSVPGMDIARTGTAVTVRHVAMEFFVTGHPSTGGKKLPLETS